MDNHGQKRVLVKNRIRISVEISKFYLRQSNTLAVSKKCYWDMATNVSFKNRPVTRGLSHDSFLVVSTLQSASV